MATILQESRFPLMIAKAEERKNVLFHIAHVEGLPARSGWTPLSGTCVSLDRLDTNESFYTEHKKITPGQTKWIENFPLLQVTDSSKVLFAIKHQALLNKRTVLGTTEPFTVRELLSMQKAADHGIDKLVKILVVLDPAGIRGPKSRKLSRASLNNVLTPTPQSPRASLDVPTSAPTSRTVSPVHFLASSNPQMTPKYATLHLTIRETAVDPKMNIRVNAANWKTFVETCREDSLEELRGIVQKIAFLRNTFEDDNNSICLIDIILGAIEATRKLLSDPETMNVNRHIIHATRTINAAFTPYQSLSQRQLAKRGEASILFLHQMLSSVVSAMWVIGAVFAAKGDAVVRDKLESRVIAWTDYFQQCTTHLNGHSDQKPILPAHKTSSTRVRCPKTLGPSNRILPHNMVPMVIPEVYPNDLYDRPDIVRRLSEWVFSSTFNHTPSPTRESISFAITSPPHSPSAQPSSPRQLHRPVPLNLKGDDNFNGILRVSEPARSTPSPPPPPPTSSYSDAPSNRVFCLSGSPGSGKTQLAARMCEWLVQLKCLGGYFTFDDDFVNRYPSSQILDGLPMTLIHHMSVVEPDAVKSFNKALTLEEGALHYPIERRFETLFVEPVREFVAGRTNAKWNPLDPLVFIIDGVGNSGGSEDPSETELVARAFVDWICSGGFGRMPRFVKFLVLMRSDSQEEKLLKARGIDVFEMGPNLVRLPPKDVQVVGSINNGGFSVNGGKWPSNATTVKSGTRAAL